MESQESKAEKKLELGLMQFGVEGFDVLDFVDKICSQGEDIATADLVHGDLSELMGNLDLAVQQVDQMAVAVGKRIKIAKDQNESLSKELVELVRTQKREQEAAAKQFRSLERKFGRSSDTAIQIGSRLNHLDQVRTRAVHAQTLLRYFNEFMFETEIRSALFIDFPRTLVDAAPIIHDLENIIQDISLPGLEEGSNRIVTMSTRVFNELLDEFDRAANDGDLGKMHACANAILCNFVHKNGAEVLFGRFVDKTLKPLIEARKRSIAFRNAALKDNLAHLFSQIRGIVGRTHAIVARVFPDRMDEVLSLLVGKLFKDQEYGLQSILHDFLFPSHRDGKLPQYEYLQILLTAHRETAQLSHELVKGFQNVQQQMKKQGDFNQRAISNGPQNKPEYQESSLKSLVTAFDSAFVQRQMKAVFLAYTGDYSAKEVQLFEQRMSKRLYSTFPESFLVVSCPNLEPPPEIVTQRRQKELLAASQGAIDSQATDSVSYTANAPPPSPPSKTRNGPSTTSNTSNAAPEKLSSKKKGKGAVMSEKDKATAIIASRQAQFRADPVAFARSLLSEEKDTNLRSLMYRALQLRTTWKEDMESLQLDQLLSHVSQKVGENWKLDDIDEMLQEPEEATSPVESDAFDLQHRDSKEEEKKSFATIFYDLRGAPGQIIRWGFEAHSRCMDLLSNKVIPYNSTSGRVEASKGTASSDESPTNPAPFALKNSEDNKVAFDAVETLFQSFCDHFFLSTILGVVHLLIGSLPQHVVAKRADAGPQPRHNVDEIDMFPEIDTAKPYILCLDGPELHPSSLPSLLPNHSQVKSTSAQIAKIAQSRSDFGEALVPSEILLFVASLHAVEDCIAQALLYWRDVIFPTLSEIPNRSSSCQAFMENRLRKVEEEISDGIKEQLNHACVLLQACVVALQQSTDYAPKEEMGGNIDQTSRWVPLVSQVVSAYLEIFARIGNGKIRDTCMIFLSFAARDVFLANLKRSKVSMQGGFTLLQDITTLHKTVMENPFCSRIPIINQMWAEMRSIGHLFLVQPDVLPSFVSEDGLRDLDKRFLFECLSKREDFRSASAARGEWLKALFLT